MAMKIAYINFFRTSGKKLYCSAKKQAPGFAWGFLASVAIWIPNYYGYFDFGLPKHYSYEVVDHQITQSLPKGYAYESRILNNFRAPGTNSLLVHGYPSWLFGNHPADNSSDVLLIYDQRGNQYDLTYRFEPKSSLGLHINNLEVVDLNNNGRPEVAIGWAYLGAHWSDSSITVLEAQSNGVKLLGLPDISIAGAAYPYTSNTIVNAFNTAEKVKTSSSEEFYTKANQEAVVVYRNNDSCYACVEDDVWYVKYLNLFDHKIFFEDSQSDLGYHGWQAVRTQLKNDGFNVR